VIETLKEHHVFLFPTLGENYGHVIQEALAAGCAVVLSNQTPWQDLEKQGIGYVYEVDATKSYAKAIEDYAQMDQERFQGIVDKVLIYAANHSNNKVSTSGYRYMFHTL
jgi:glycosyltransferase involved in cell wall biosynthesis